MTRTWVKLLAVSAVTVAAMAGCSSSGSSSTGSASTLTSGGQSPILIGSMASLSNPAYSSPQVRDGILAAMDAINAAGGVGGHPLKLDFCDTDFTANGELSCARKLVSDKVAALVNPAVLADPSGEEYAIFAKARIPVIGTEGESPSELNSPVVFPLSSGVPGWVYGTVDSLVRAGSNKIALFLAGGPTGQFLGGLATAALSSAHLAPVRTVTEDVAADPTLDSAAAELVAGGVDGIVLFCSPINVPKALLALKQEGYTGKIASITGLFAPALLQAAGASADGVLLTSQVAFTTETSNPAVEQFHQDIQKYVPNAIVDETTLFSWSAVQLLSKVAGPAKATTSAEILAAFSHLKAPVNIGSVPAYSTATASPLKSYPRIFNATVQFGIVRNGVLTPNGDGFVNPFTDLLGH